MRSIFIWPLAAVLVASLPVVVHATEGGNIISSINKNIGEDQISCRIVTLQRPANSTSGYIDLDAWVVNNYGGDVSMPVHLIPNTSREMNVKGSIGLLFKTLERESIVQNLLVDNGKNLVLYQTPHNEKNPDGGTVFSQLLGLSTPAAADTNINADDYIDSLETRAATDNNAN